MGLFSSDAPRRDLTRNDLAGRGVASLVVVGLVLGVVWMSSRGAFDDTPELTTRFTNVGGALATGSDVKVRGNIIGEVTKIEEGDGLVDVTVAIDEAELGKVPGNVQASVLPATVFGTSFIDLAVPVGQQPRGELERGATVVQDADTIELQRALDDIDALVKALGPAELASAIGAAAQALNGRGEQIGQIVDRTNTLLAKVNPEWGLLSEDIRLLADNLEIVSEHAPGVLDAVDDLLFSADTVVDKRRELTTFLTGGTALFEKSEAFVAGNRKRLQHSIRLGSIVLDAVYDNRKEALSGAFHGNVHVSRNLMPTLTDGWAWARLFVSTDDPAYYTGGDCTGYQGRVGCR